MILYIIILLLFLGFVACDIASQSNENQPSPFPIEAYNLVWDENFDNNTLDLKSWEYQLGDGCPDLCGWGNNEGQWYTDDIKNVSVKDGFLYITALKESKNNKEYTSARLRTKGKRDFKFGRIDVRAKLPKGQGIWPAIWLLPTDEVFGGWPKSGEIDLVELVGHEPNVLWGTVHYGPAWPNNKLDNNRYYLPKGDFSDDFHVFSLLWQENEIIWLLDNQQIYQRIIPNMLQPENYPFNERFHLILNVAVGGNWPGYPDATTVFPQEMVVDYVKVYQKK
ncbi:MAG: glycoside hydrolase family 16 protein [Saprospiraceae bacterium]|nr:glycoside hydrolase family 16 protein [Saprospiraceae bacterium]